MVGRSSLRLLALVVAGVAGCDRPSPRIICHNANCTGDLDAARDDTFERLEESIALTHQGRPPWDGIEIDSVWHGDEDRCLFAHAFDTADGAPPLSDAADAIAAHLLTSSAPSWTNELFILDLELKGDVGPGFRRHAPDERAPHVECAFDAIDQVRAAADAAGVELEAIVDSADPEMTSAAVRHPRWEASGALLSADFGPPPPFTSDTAELADFPTGELDMVQIYPGLLPHATMEAFRSLDVDVNVWMFSATSEILDEIEHLDPPRVVTGEATFMRRWIER